MSNDHILHTRFTNHITSPHDSTRYHPITQSPQPTHSPTRTTHRLLLIHELYTLLPALSPNHSQEYYTHTHTSPHTSLPTINRNAQTMHYSPLLNPINATPNAASNNKSKKERNRRRRITHTPPLAKQTSGITDLAPSYMYTHSAPLRPSNLRRPLCGKTNAGSLLMCKERERDEPRRFVRREREERKGEERKDVVWKERHEKGEEETEGEAGLATQAQRIDDTNRTAITHPLTAPTYTPRRPHAQAKKKRIYKEPLRTQFPPLTPTATYSSTPASTAHTKYPPTTPAAPSPAPHARVTSSHRTRSPSPRAQTPSPHPRTHSAASDET